MLSRALCATALLLSVSSHARAESGLFALATTALPNFAALGVGSANDYLGSDERFTGAAPALRLSMGGARYFALTANYASMNLVDHPNLRIGPTGLLRFGRSDVEDQAVASLPEIDPTLELGGSVAWETVNPQDVRFRWRFGLDVTQDVLGEHKGSVTSASIRRFFGIGRATIGALAIAGSYGSGNYMETYFSVGEGEALEAFEAGAGLRDLRLQAMVIQPLSRQWSLGAGVQYQRLLGDAADSPIVADAGDRDQWIFGVGAARSW